MFDKGVQSVSDFGSKVGSQIKDVGSGIYNLATDAPGAMDAFKASGATLGNTVVPAFVGYSGIAALDEQERFLKEQLEKGDIGNAEYNQMMERIAESRRRGEQAMRDNPYRFAEGGEVPGYFSGGSIRAIMAAARNLLKPQVAASSVPSPVALAQQASNVGIASDTVKSVDPSSLQAMIAELIKRRQSGMAAGGSVDDSPGYDEGDYMSGGITSLAAGGQPRFLSGGGDGMSDSIKANINGNQPARLADGEFVIPADVVSHLGNGSSKAGAKQLYSMMDKVRSARTGTKKQGKQINPARFMPA
jgi:hypothetical protein